MRARSFAYLVGLANAVACGESVATSAADGGADATLDDSASDAILLGPEAGAPDVAAPTPPLDAGDPPVVACADAAVDDAGDGGACALPHSVCADSHWLVYYVGGDCVGGVCAWQKKFLYCGNGVLCMQGACVARPTAPTPQ